MDGFYVLLAHILRNDVLLPSFRNDQNCVYKCLTYIYIYIYKKESLRETRRCLGSCVFGCALTAPPPSLQVDVKLRRDGESAQHFTRRSEARERTLAVATNTQVVVEVHVH